MLVGPSRYWIAFALIRFCTLIVVYNLRVKTEESYLELANTSSASTASEWKSIELMGNSSSGENMRVMKGINEIECELGRRMHSAAVEGNGQDIAHYIQVGGDPNIPNAVLSFCINQTSTLI